MSWVRFVPGFSRHPKRLKCGPISSWLWVCSVDHCVEHRTDGFLDDAAIPSLCGTLTGSALKRAVENLLAVGSWERVPGGYMVHDFLRHNLSKAQVEEDIELARQRQRRWQKERAGPRQKTPTQRVDNASPNASLDA